MSSPQPPKGKRLRGHAPAPGRTATLLTVLWLALAGLVYFLRPGGGAAETSPSAAGIVVLVALVLPVVMIWFAALTAHELRRLRDENRKLRAAIGRLHAQDAEAPHSDDDALAALERKVAELARTQKKAEAALARLNSVNARPATGPAHRAAEPPAPRRAPEPDADQPTLALEAPVPAPEPISVADFIRAIDFPRDAKDNEGFRALAIARRDHEISGLLRSAEDVLTLLAEGGTYMDDLTPDRARPEIWRRFAKGERGGPVADLGGIRDPESLERAAERMRQDPVFRDCAHHFLRRFDTALDLFEEIATDEELAAFAETRSARAFMLLGRVSGIFD